ncbi:MAG: hypothetical protein LBV22_03825 [Mycoplasmataceae bacterium]|jgi:F0F1-type ATP synthase epsilon subunit|nr:hypothetical protein [Mycoplasmataceae bacterium]
MNREFDLSVLTPTGAKIKNICYSVGFKSHGGELVVYAGYTPFISTVDTCVLKVLTNENKTINAIIGPGLIKVYEHQVVVMTDFFQADPQPNDNPNTVRSQYIDKVIQAKLRTSDPAFEALHQEFAEEVARFAQQEIKTK